MRAKPSCLAVADVPGERRVGGRDDHAAGLGADAPAHDRRDGPARRRATARRGAAPHGRPPGATTGARGRRGRGAGPSSGAGAGCAAPRRSGRTAARGRRRRRAGGRGDGRADAPATSSRCRPRRGVARPGGRRASTRSSVTSMASRPPLKPLAARDTRWPVLCVVGDLVEDVVVRLTAAPAWGDRHTGRSITRSRGGSAANVAAAAATAGCRDRFVGRVGDDAAGERLVDGLSRSRRRRAGAAGRHDRHRRRARRARWRADDAPRPRGGAGAGRRRPGVARRRHLAPRAGVLAVRRADRHEHASTSSRRVRRRAAAAQRRRVVGVGRRGVRRRPLRRPARSARPDVVLATVAEAALLGELRPPLLVVKDGPRPGRAAAGRRARETVGRRRGRRGRRLDRRRRCVRRRVPRRDAGRCRSRRGRPRRRGDRGTDAASTPGAGLVPRE